MLSSTGMFEVVAVGTYWYEVTPAILLPCFHERRVHRAVLSYHAVLVKSRPDVPAAESRLICRDGQPDGERLLYFLSLLLLVQRVHDELTQDLLVTVRALDPPVRVSVEADAPRFIRAPHPH